MENENALKFLTFYVILFEIVQFQSISLNINKNHFDSIERLSMGIIITTIIINFKVTIIK